MFTPFLDDFIKFITLANPHTYFKSRSRNHYNRGCDFPIGFYPFNKHFYDVLFPWFLPLLLFVSFIHSPCFFNKGSKNLPKNKKSRYKFAIKTIHTHLGIWSFTDIFTFAFSSVRAFCSESTVALYL